MVETFPEHLDLDNAVQGTVLEVADYSFLFILVQFAVNDLGPVPAFFVEGANALPVIDGAGDRDYLMLGAGQAKLFELFQAVIDNAHVTRIAEGNSAAEPLFLLHGQDFVEREGALAAGHSERQLCWRYIGGLQLLDVSLDAGAFEGIPVNEIAFEFLAIAAEGRGGQVDNLGHGESGEYQFPA